MIKNLSISSAILLLTIGLFIFLININSETIAREKITSTKIKSEEIDIGIELEREIKEGKSFTSSITIPIANIENIDEHLKEWAIKQEDQFFSYIKQADPKLSKQAEAQFTIEPIVKRIKKDYLTYEMHVKYDIRDSYTETDKQTNNITTFVVDTKNGVFLSLNDVIIVPDIKNKSEFTRFLSTIPDGEEKTALEILDNKTIDSLNWLLADKHIEFIIDSADNQDKENRVVVPYSKLAKHINKPYKKQFVPKKKKKKKVKTNVQEADRKLIALTFDDGPDADVTPRILETLKKYNIKATFFMLGKSVNSFPEIAKQVADEGHEIANHSISHANLNTINQNAIRKEVIESKNIIHKATGVEPKLFRPPYGEYNETVIKASKTSDQTVIMWSVDGLDWKHKEKNKVINITTANLSANSIVLLHDIHATTADALPTIIEKMQSEGFEFVTTSELIKHIEPQSNGVYYGK